MPRKNGKKYLSQLPVAEFVKEYWPMVQLASDLRGIIRRMAAPGELKRLGILESELEDMRQRLDQLDAFIRLRIAVADARGINLLTGEETK